MSARSGGGESNTNSAILCGYILQIDTSQPGKIRFHVSADKFNPWFYFVPAEKLLSWPSSDTPPPHVVRRRSRDGEAV